MNPKQLVRFFTLHCSGARGTYQKHTIIVKWRQVPIVHYKLLIKWQNLNLSNELVKRNIMMSYMKLQISIKSNMALSYHVIS